MVEREVKRLLLPDFNTFIRADTGRQADRDPSCWDEVCRGGQGLRPAGERGGGGNTLAWPCGGGRAGPALTDVLAQTSHSYLSNPRPR